MLLDPNALRPRIRAILESADLETVSAKQVRKRLCADPPRLDEDAVKQAKAEIDEVIAELFDELRDAADTASASTASGSRPQPADSAANSPSGRPPPSSLPQPLAASSGKREKAKKVKREPRGGETDAILAQRLSDELNSHLTRGGGSGSGSTSGVRKKKDNSSAKLRKFKSEETVNDSDEDATATGVKGKRRAVSSSDDDEECDSDERPKRAKKAAKTASGQPRGGAFNKEMALSPALSELMAGERQLSRPQTVKRIWDYVKARDLQDPADRRYIVCEGDPLLTAVFQTPRVHMFTLNKILSKHLYPIDD